MEPSSTIPGTGTRPDRLAGAPAPLENHLERPSFRTALAEPSSELRFADVLDIINPLQHIPVVSSIYRAITGDEISGPARVMGSALFGGPIGMIAGVVNAIAAQASGGDLGEVAIAVLVGKDEPGLMVAAAEEPDAPPAAKAAPVLAAANSAPAPAGRDRQIALAARPEGTETSLFTGDAALMALRADLQGAEPLNETRPATETTDRAVRRRVATVEDNSPSGAPLNTFTAQMLEGLEKYRAMAADRANAQPAAYRPVDDSL